ncbi:hypothetical protein F53441_4464 [Fusarium austroafricanum]|uniref:RING finger domain-containing protein n=1 Tax=Fusarium austroafricanum TaxID=2364996 RepID=A0A8H4KKA8_9HYPO|nr:hypothetical protein F53441_4464 [Fusarium austroafricanum]
MDSSNRNTYLTAGQAASTADDAPPPPYSETDIYSTSSQPPHSPHAASAAGSGHGPAAPGDDTASRMSSTSTTDVIFTPPLTPRTDSVVNATTPTTHNIPLSPSVALYFETRPVPASASQWEPQIHTITVKPKSVPDDIPYPENWATSYDITPQDWATFVNFLLPDHDSVRNEAILGEKGKAEDGSDVKSASGDGSIKSEQHTTDPSELRRKRAEVEAIVQQWNSGFFAPRNVMVRLQPEEQSHMPGGWETTFDDPPVQLPPQAGPSAPREAVPQRRPSNWTGSWGGFQVDNDSVRWGDKFVADSSGLRIGNLVMDSRGIRMNGQPVGAPFGPGPAPVHPPPPTNARNMPPFMPGNPWQPDHPEANANAHAHPPRGRATSHGHVGPRSRSSSISSSSSSCSSASSGSIGSLPDYDDLKDQQLPLYIARLEQWTANPHEARSKADVKQLKAELKASSTNAINLNVDRKALKAQSKVLSQQWRTLKRAQKKERRDRKRDFKKKKRAEKKERRQQKKEMKAARRDLRRGQRGHNHVDQPPAPLVPPFQVPPVHVPAVNVHVPPVNVPGVRVPPAAHGGWGWGGRGCHGRGRGRGWGGCENQGPWGRGRGHFQGGWPNPGPSSRGGFFGVGEWPSRSREGPPGSWPADGDSQDANIPPPGAASAAKYNTVAGLETEIATKQKDLEAKQVTLGERRALEKEIEALTETMERTRLEADEAYARELATQFDGQC